METTYLVTCKTDIKKILWQKTITRIYVWGADAKMYLKVPEREMQIDTLVKDAKFVNDSIVNTEESKSMKEVVSRNIVLHRKVYGNYCDYKNCEYFLNHKKYD